MHEMLAMMRAAGTGIIGIRVLIISTGELLQSMQVASTVTGYHSFIWNNCN